MWRLRCATSTPRRRSIAIRSAPTFPSGVPLPEHGVTTVFVTLPNTKIELLEPLGENSPIAKFLERNADGGIHHICYEVDDIIAARDHLTGKGARVLGDGDAEDRRAWQAGAVPAPEGFLRHAGRAGAGMTRVRRKSRMSCRGVDDNCSDLFHHLVGGAVRRPAVGRASRRRNTARKSRRAPIRARRSCRNWG